MRRTTDAQKNRALKANLIEQAIFTGLASFRHNKLTKDGDLALCIRTALYHEARLSLKLKIAKAYRSATADEREWEACSGPTSELTTFTGCDNKVTRFDHGDFYCTKHTPSKDKPEPFCSDIFGI